MAEHVRSDTESLTLKLPGEMVSVAVDAELLVVLPTFPGAIVFPQLLHPSPHQQSQTGQQHHRQHSDQDTKE